MVALLVVLTFVVFLVISSLLQRKQVERSVEELACSTRRVSLPFPKGYFFSPNHTWLSLESSGDLTVGIDELVQRFLGKVKSVKLKNSGDYIMKGEELIVLDIGDTVLRITSPVSGKIETANYEIDQTPQKLTDDPYQSCWLYSIKPSHLSNDIKSFKIAENARSWLSTEFSRLKDFVLSHQAQPALANSTLSDGGTLIHGLANHLDKKAIFEFERQFLMTLNEDN